MYKEMTKEEMSIFARALRINHKVKDCKVRRKMIQESYHPCLRVSVTFIEDAVYCIHYDLHYVITPEGLYDVYLEGKTVILTETKDGKYRYKRDVQGSGFAGPLGILTLQQVVDMLKRYTTKIVGQ